LTGRDRGLAADTTQREDHDGCEDAEYDDNDENFNQGKTALRFGVVATTAELSG
jgi:hypothetical protein